MTYKRTILALFLTALRVSTLPGQSTYEKTYGVLDTVSSSFICSGIAFDNTSSSLILGTGRYNFGPTTPGITKMDTCGNIIWSRETSQSGTMYFNTISTYSGTSSVYFSSDGLFGSGSWIGNVGTFNSSGTLTSINSFYTSATAIDAHPVGAKRLPNGDHLITGYAARTGNFKDIWFAKLDVLGNVIWSKMSGQVDFFWENGWGVDVNTTNDAYYFVGQNISFSTNNSTDIHVIKTDVNGNVIWEKQISTTGTDIAFSVKVMPNDDIVIGGQTNGTATGNQYITLLRMDMNGNLLWSKYYDGLPGNNVCRNLNTLPNGNILVTGYSDAYGPGLLNGLLMEVNNTGNIVWQKAYGSPGSDSFVNSVIYNNAIYSAGTADSTGAPNKLRVYLVKTRLDGSFEAGSLCFATPTSFTETAMNYTIFDISNVETNSLTVPQAYTSFTNNPNTIVICGQPTASFTAPASLCVGQTFSLTDQSTGGVSSWTWSSTGGNIPTPFTQNQTALTFSASGIYTITLMVSNCVGLDSIKKTILVNLSNTITLTSNAPLCVNSTLSLSAVSAASSFSWTGPNGFSSTSQNPVVPNIQTNNSGIYSVSATQFSSNCVSTGTINVTVSPIPLPAITVIGPSPVCEGSSVVLNGTGATSYTWQPGGVTGLSIAITPTANTTYTVIGSNPGGCQNSASTGISVVNVPSVSVTGNPVICQNNSTLLTATGALFYSWNNGVVSSSITVTPGVSTTYSVTGTAVNGCTNSAVFPVTVNPLPQLTILGPTITCITQSVILNASGAGNYVWSNGATTSSVPVNPGGNTSFSVTGTDTASGCAASASVQLLVVTLPTLTINGTKKICSGEGIALTANGALNYLWNNGSTAQTLLDFPTSDMVYTVTGSNAPLPGCSVTTSVSVKVNPVPTLTLNGNTKLCIGNSVTITASGADSYLWANDNSQDASIIVNNNVTTVIRVTGTFLSTGCSSSITETINVYPFPTVKITGPDNLCKGTAGILRATGANSYIWNNVIAGNSLSVSPETATTYSVTGTSAEGCSGKATFFLPVSLPPQIAITGNTNACQGEPVFLFAEGGNTYYWNNGTSDKQLIITANESKEINVVGYDTKGCYASSKVNIRVNPLPKASIVADSTLSNCQYQYSLRSARDPQIRGYNWFINGESVSGLSELIVPVSQNDSKEILLKVISDKGCKNETKRTLKTDDLYDNLVYIPNAFTPNGDGKNEKWGIYSECLETWQCSIYNRWGNLVCLLKNGSEWDGTYKGLPVQDNIYVYKLSGRFYSNKLLERSGHITILK